MTRIKGQLFIIGFILLTFLFDCNGPPPPSEGELNFIVASSGDVLLNRGRWSTSASIPVGFGTTVQRGDLIQIASGESVTILCADLSIHIVTEKSGSPCQVQEEPPLVYEGIRVLTPRKPVGEIPYILHPRNTAVLDSNPWLWWHDTGATSYTVAITERGQTIWQQTDVTGTQLRYPDDAQSLEPDKVYLLEVTTEDTNRSSNEDPVPGLGFRLFSADDQAQLMAQRDRILALPLDEPARFFVLAIYYAGQCVDSEKCLRGEAVLLLDETTNAFDAPRIQLWRGQLLLEMRLSEEAEVAFRDALREAKTLGDIETQAEAQAGLWKATGDMKHFDQAIMLYQESLGDTAAVNMLRQMKNR